MKLSVVIPAHDEEGSIAGTVEPLILFVVPYLFLEKHLSREDYRKTSGPDGRTTVPGDEI